MLLLARRCPRLPGPARQPDFPVETREVTYADERYFFARETPSPPSAPPQFYARRRRSRGRGGAAARLRRARCSSQYPPR